MRGFLLDTCVISESTRPRPSPEVLAWLEAKPAESLYLSVLTIGELEQGIAQLGTDARAARLATWLRDVVVPQFDLRILDVDRVTATRWGRLIGTARRAGRQLPVVDTLLGATALAHDLAIVTRNVADFIPLGAQVVNPWQ
jgi:predicted nucleic acid-binding protein